MRRLLPSPIDHVDVADAYRPPDDLPAGRPFVRSDFVMAVDGAVTVEGTSRGLAGPADKAAFVAMRAWADVVLVGASTVRVEGYGPVRLSDEQRAARDARGQRPVPPVAVVTRTLQLDYAAPLFTEAACPTIVICPGGVAEDLRRHAADVADVLVAGEGADVDLAAALAQLGVRDAHHVLTEGGPTLHGELVRAHLVDEICVTISPMVADAGPSTPRLLGPLGADQPVDLRLTHLFEADEGFLFARYRF